VNDRVPIPGKVTSVKSAEPTVVILCLWLVVIFGGLGFRFLMFIVK
jgi:hypothetical protein